MESTVRINVFLAAKLGISRRKADQAISEYDVRINGMKAVLGQTINPIHDLVTLNGLEVKNHPITTVRLALYKPPEYITTRSDQWGRKTVINLLPKTLRHLNPAGRLDYISDGLLLISNDLPVYFLFLLVLLILVPANIQLMQEVRLKHPRC